MPYQINIFHLQVNGITKNGNVNVGSTVQNSHTANTKLYGAVFSQGDFSPVSSTMKVKVLESRMSDQNQN